MRAKGLQGIGFRTMSLGLLALALLGGVSGCANVPLLSSKLTHERMSLPYERTQIKASSSLDVLAVADSPDYRLDPNDVGMQLLSQSNTMAALSGRSKNGRKTWVNLVVFDERRVVARRKSFFCSDEKATTNPAAPSRRLFPARKGILFDAQFVLDSDILTAPFATAEARQIAILRWLAEQYSRDVRHLTGRADSPVAADELVSTAGMMMNQVFQGVLVALSKSPGLARNLRDANGIEFPHISLDTGRIQMILTGDVVTVKTRVNLPMTASKRRLF